MIQKRTLQPQNSYNVPIISKSKIATGCHFKDPIALRHKVSLALPYLITDKYYTVFV